MIEGEQLQSIRSSMRMTLIALSRVPWSHLVDELREDTALAKRLGVCDDRLLSPAELHDWTLGLAIALERCNDECIQVMADVRDRMDTSLVAEMEKATREAARAIPPHRGDPPAADR